MGSDGLEPSISEDGRVTASCNSRYANCPLFCIIYIEIYLLSIKKHILFMFSMNFGMTSRTYDS